LLTSVTAGFSFRLSTIDHSPTLSSPSHAPAPEELDALIRLLDDDTPEVRRRVTERLLLHGGDLSEWLASRPHTLGAADRAILAEVLRPARRAALERDWLVPSGGAAAMGDDWDALEAMLRVVSDFLHDGTSIRQPLSDALDLLAEEAEEAGVGCANELRAFLFEEDRLVGNEEGYHDSRNSDLAWSIAEGHSNPLGLALIFLLVAHRLDLVVEAVNFPGHFLCRIYEDGFPIIVDCFSRGQLHLQAALLEDPEIGRQERDILRHAASPGSVLLRLLNNLHEALQHEGRREDARLIRKLRASLR
jgi:hypothetical protein